MKRCAKYFEELLSRTVSINTPYNWGIVIKNCMHKYSFIVSELLR